MKDTPNGWTTRRSGIVVPAHPRRGRRLRALFVTVLAAMMIVPTAASDVSAIARGVADTIAALHAALSVGVTDPVCPDRSP